MTKARKNLISIEDTPYYHITALGAPSLWLWL